MLKKPAASFLTKPVPPEYFTGTAWLTSLVKNEGIPCNVARVTFEPGARNHWHTHPVGQILIVTEGKGFVQKKGEPRQELLPGDVVTILADEIHWHGATPSSSFTHVAIQLVPATGEETVWLNPVTEDEYAKN